MKSSARNKVTFLLALSILFCIILYPSFMQVHGQDAYVPRHRLTIQVNNSIGGTTSPSPGVSYIDNGISVQVTAKPSTGYVFNGWYLNGVYQNKLSVITVTMLGDNVLMASFTQQTGSLTVGVNPEGGGTTDPPVGTYAFPIASYVQATAQPNPGYVFDGWYLDGDFLGTDSIITVIISGNQQLEAYFGGTAPSPTSAPTPTPTPLPQAAIDVSVESSVTYSGFSAEIAGTLSGSGIGLANQGIFLYLSVSGGTSWDILSYVKTDANGEFAVLWKPSVTGNYLLNTTWLGNSEYSTTSNVVNFALAPFEEESVFSVTSNSTLSGLLFDSANNLLSFNVEGPSGTTGYVDTIIPKTLMNSVSNLKVYLDGNELSFDSISQTDSWTITFTYSHSSHQVTINLSAESQTETFTEQLRNLLPYIFIAAIIIVVVAVVVVLVAKKRKKKIT